MGIAAATSNLRSARLLCPCGTQVLANDFAQHGAIVHGALQVTAADGEHGAVVPGVPGNGVAGVAIQYAARTARLAESFDRAACNPHGVRFGMVGAVVV